MDKKGVEKALAKAVRALSDVLPLKSYLLFPVVYSVCVWAVRRVFDYRARILSWQAWLEPGAIGTKPDDFVLRFFRDHGGLAREYAEELQARNMRALRKVFPKLYPVIGIEDPFLQGLFEAELKAEAYRDIVDEFAARGTKARADIAAASEDGRFWRDLEAAGMELASLGIHLFTDDEVRRLILEQIRKRDSRRSASGGGGGA
jgi:hypothetical protein